MSEASIAARDRHRELVRGRSLAERSLAPDFAERDPARAFLYRAIAALNPKRPPDFLAPRPGQGGGSVADRLHASGVPVLFVSGDRDEVVAPAVMREAHAALSGSRYVEILGSGHSAYFERPDAFNDAVLPFLREAWAIEETTAATASGEAAR
jgi:pimeloyl-ACP methyl ester carboxylesterase